MDQDQESSSVNGLQSQSSTAWRKGSISFSLLTGQSCHPAQVTQHYLYPHKQGFSLHSFQFPPTTSHRGVVHITHTLYISLKFHTLLALKRPFTTTFSAVPFYCSYWLDQKLYPLAFRQFWLVKFLVPTSYPLPLWHTYVMNSANPEQASIFLQNLINLNFYNMSQNTQDYHLYNTCYEHLKANSLVTCGHWHYNIQSEHMNCGWFYYNIAHEVGFIFITVYMVVYFVCFCLILQIMYFYCYVYIFLLSCIFCSVYCLCVNGYHTTATRCQPNCTNISYHEVRSIQMKTVF